MYENTVLFRIIPNLNYLQIFLSQLLWIQNIVCTFVMSGAIPYNTLNTKSISICTLLFPKAVTTDSTQAVNPLAVVL